MNCFTSALVGIALLGGSLATLTITKSEHEKLQKVLTPELANRYVDIVKERRNQYIQGIILGMIIGTIVLYVYQWKVTQNFHKVVLFSAITLFIAMIYYLLMPKSDYMLKHLQNEQQNRAWLDIYKSFQSRYIVGMILGAVAAVPIANSYCL
jgi:fructose-specific phosphotransferase system IIC component